MIRTTSKLAYLELAESGKLARSKQLFYDYLKFRPAMSRLEISKGTGQPINIVSGRINDLKRMGIVIEVSKRYCTITGSLITPVTVEKNGTQLNCFEED